MERIAPRAWLALAGLPVPPDPIAADLA